MNNLNAKIQKLSFCCSSYCDLANHHTYYFPCLELHISRPDNWKIHWGPQRPPHSRRPGILPIWSGWGSQCYTWQSLFRDLIGGSRWLRTWILREPDNLARGQEKEAPSAWRTQHHQARLLIIFLIFLLFLLSFFLHVALILQAENDLKLPSLRADKLSQFR